MPPSDFFFVFGKFLMNLFGIGMLTSNLPLYDELLNTTLQHRNFPDDAI